jgi:signal transduction histidine kinase
MKLARKIVLALFVTFLAGFALQSTLRTRWAIQTFEDATRAEHHLMGRALAAAIVSALRHGGEAEVRALVSDANVREDQVRIRWLPGPDALHGGREVTYPVDEQGQRRLVTYVPIAVDGRLEGVVELSESLAHLQQYERRTILDALITALALALACGGMAAILGFWLVGRPVRALTERARQIGAGDFSGRLPQGQRDEIGKLAEEMNRMSELLAKGRDETAAAAAAQVFALEQLRHADRLSTVGKIASGLAHELGTPLNVIGARAKMISSGELAGPDGEASARIIVEQTQKMTHLIRQLLDSARTRTPTKASVDVRQLATHTLNLLEPLAEKERVTLELGGGPPAVVHADGAQVEQALTNLVVNGIQAMPEGGRVTVEIAEEQEKGFIRIDVLDRGVGISEEARPHVFQPFFTTKGVGKGTGLGLSVAYGLIRDHGGWISVESELGHGSRFSIHLPKEG